MLVYIRKWRLSKSTVMVFSRESVDDGWKWGEHVLPRVSKYTYLHWVLILLSSTGAWNVHKTIRKKVHQLHSVITKYGST